MMNMNKNTSSATQSPSSAGGKKVSPAKKKRVQKRTPRAVKESPSQTIDLGLETVTTVEFFEPRAGTLRFPAKVASAIIAMSAGLLDPAVNHIPRTASLNVGGDLYMISNDQVKSHEGKIIVRHISGFYELEDLRGRAHRQGERLSIMTRQLAKNPSAVAIPGTEFAKQKDRSQQSGIREEAIRQERRRAPRVEERLRVEEELTRITERMGELGGTRVHQITLGDIEAMDFEFPAILIEEQGPALA